MGVKHKNLKYLSIERLENIRANQYRSICGQFEYYPELIDAELNRKYTERDEREAEELLNAYEQMEVMQMEQTTNIEQVESTGKLSTLAPIYTNEDNALILEVDTSELSARNARNKYTHRKHWIEYKPKHGYRYCYASYDNSRKRWCSPKRGTYNMFLRMRLVDNDVTTIGFYSLWDFEKTQEKIDKYAFNDADTKWLTDTFETYKNVNKAYSDAMEDAKKEAKEEAKTLSDYKFNSLYKESEIAKSTDDIDLIVFRVTGKGIKKRCRNSERIFENVGYIIAQPDQTREEAANSFIDDILLKSQAKKILTDKYREVDFATIEAKKCTLNARSGDSPFYGMREMLMESPLARLALEVE